MKRLSLAIAPVACMLVFHNSFAIQKDPVKDFIESLRVKAANYYDAIATGNIEHLRSQLLSKSSLKIIDLSCASLTNNNLREALSHDLDACTRYALYIEDGDISSNARRLAKDFGTASIQLRDSLHATLKIDGEIVRLVNEDKAWKIDLPDAFVKRILVFSLTPQGKKEIELLWNRQ